MPLPTTQHTIDRYGSAGYGAGTSVAGDNTGWDVMGGAATPAGAVPLGTGGYSGTTADDWLAGHSPRAARPPVHFDDLPHVNLDPGNGLQETWTRVASTLSKAVAAPMGDEIVSVTDMEPFIPTNVVRQITSVPCLEKKFADSRHDCVGEDAQPASPPAPSTAA